MKKNNKIFIHNSDFPLIDFNEKFEEKFKAYVKSHPELDPEYILEHCYIYRQDTRNWLESIWEKYCPFAEPDFLNRLRTVNEFHPFSWQMYIASVILEKNYNLQPNSGNGPDLHLKIDGRSIWLEAVITTPGDDISAAGIPESGNIYEGLDPRVARISNALTKKYSKYLKKYYESVCKKDEPFIIAINGSNTDTLMGSRAAEATVYGRGNDVFKRTKDRKLKGGFYEARESIKIMKEGSQIIIPTNYFCNDSYKEISGIIYCEQHIINANNYGRNPEETLYFLLNPYATNKINPEEFKIGNLICMDEKKQIHNF